MRTLKVVPGACALLMAATVALSACAQTHGNAASDDLSWSEDPHPDFALSPRLEGPGADGINAALATFDAGALAGRADCAAAGGEWTRTVWTPFAGPRFLTVAINDSFYCGGAYPSVSLIRLTVDRRTGSAPDWTTLWPAAGILAASQADGLLPSTTQAPAVIDWFRAAVREDPENDAEWLDQCDGWYGADAPEEPVMIWLDAAAGGIAMDWAYLPHVAMACGSPQVMPLDVAAQLGASPELIDAMRQGHAEWIERTPELP